MSIWIREMDFLANLVKQRIYSSETIVEALDKAEHLKIVRCEDCKYWNEETHGCNRNPSVGAWWESDFCSYGELANATQHIESVEKFENTEQLKGR